MRTNTILCLLALAGPLRAGELAPAQVPASAQWLLHADIDAMRGSDTGKAIFSKIEAEHGDQLRAFKRMFSLHPLTDLHDVTLYGDGKKDHAVVLIDGTFDRVHMEEVIKGADNHATENHADFNIHTWTDKGATQHAAFASDALLIFSRQDDLLRSALDVVKANASVEADPFFAATNGAPLVAAKATLAGIEMPADAARILKMASGLHVTLSENAGRFTVRAGVEAADAAAGDRLRRMLDGVIAFAEVADPKLGGLDIACEITPSVGKPGLNAALSLPTGQWLEFLKKAADEKKK